MFAGCLAASVATAGLTGCHTEDRTAGTYLDDRRVAMRVENNLKNDPVYKYRDVHVNVFEGVAQISGFVDTQQQVSCAATIASRTDGVREVINDVALKPQFKLVPQAQGAAGTSAGMSSGAQSGNNAYKGTTGQNAPIINSNPNAATQGGTLQYNEKNQYNSRDIQNNNNTRENQNQ